MPDFAKVQRNVTKMIDAGAPERDIDLYLRTEKTNPARLRAYGKRAKDYGATDLAASKFTLGFADKVGAVGDAIGGEIRERVTGGPDVSFGERYDTALGAEREAKDAYKEANPGVDWATSPLNFLAGAPAKTGMAAIRAARVAGGVGGGAQAYANSDGSPLEQAGQTAAGAVVGATLGDLAARYVPRAVNTLANAVRPTAQKIGQRLRPHTEAVQTGVEGAADANIDPRAAGRAIYEAAQRQGVRVLPADVGGTGTRMATGAVGRTLGGLPLAAGARASIDSVAAARTRVAGTSGSIADDATGAGQVAQRGVKRFMENTKKRGNKLFESIPIARDRDASIVGTRTALTDLTAEMSSNPELSDFFRNPRLEGYLRALTPKAEKQATGILDASGDSITRTVEKGGKLSWSDLKEFRTRVGDMLSDARLSEKIPERQLRALYGALSQDMEATAKAAGPQAHASWRRANNFWDGRQKRIDDVIAGVVGQRKDMTANEAYAQIERWASNGASGDFARLGRLLRTMPKEDAGVVRATVISRLGNAKAGAQGAEGVTFSPAEFASQWNKLSPRAKSFLFNDAKVRADLDDLAKITADGMKAANAYQNFSNTSLGTNALAAGAGIMTSPLTTAALAGASYGAGKLLSSQALVRWLTRAAKIEAARPGVAQALKGHVGQLSAIAAREPTIRNEVLALQQRLQEALSKPPQRLAAEEEPDNVRREPPAQRQQ